MSNVLELVKDDDQAKAAKNRPAGVGHNGGPPIDLEQLRHAEWLPAPIARKVIPLPPTSFYRALNSGGFRAKRMGAALYVHMASYRAFMESLPEYEPGHAPKPAVDGAARARAQRSKATRSASSTKPATTSTMRRRKLISQDPQPPP